MEYRDRMYAAAYRLLKDSYAAEDVVSNIICSIIPRIDNLDMVNMGAYLCVAARYEAIKVINSRKRLSAAPVDDYAIPDNRYSPEQILVRRETAAEIMQTFYELPQQCQTVFYYKCVAGLKHSQIAQRLSITESASVTRLSKARELMKDKIRRKHSNSQCRKGSYNMEILKVSSASQPKSVAGAIAGVVRNARKVEIHAIGAAAVNQALKSIAIARGYVAPNGIDLICIPGFIQMDVDGEIKTSMRFTVESRS